MKNDDHQKIIELLNKISEKLDHRPLSSTLLFKIFYFISTIVFAGLLAMLDVDHDKLVKLVDDSASIVLAQDDNNMDYD